jgi:AraC-like DNA-binding protein
MHAHFEQHSYHMHSHESYSFGLTELGAQAFGCRGEPRTSAAGMVMAFNRIIHIDPSLITDVLADQTGRAAGLPLFADPVLHDPVLATALGRLYGSLTDEASTLAKDEALAETVAALVRRAARTAPAAASRLSHSAETLAARRAKDVLDQAFLEPLSADDLANAAGCSRFALYRAFKASYGFSPSDYQRQLRLRNARRLIAAGSSAAEAAVWSGFADQAHLTRWFRRCYGLTPGAYQRAT